jgi:hypothetical protein
MHFYSFLLSACLVGQTGTEPAQAVIPPPANVTSGSTRATTDQLLADAIAPPIGGSITGRPISLLTTIAAMPDRQRQLEAVHAYWRLAQAVGDYRTCYERQQRLGRLKAAGEETAELRTAQAVAIAHVHEAELQATTAQHELAAKLNFPETAPLPLPADRPLSESYRTRFAELFAARKAPVRLRMLNQTLPLWQRAVESHTAAVLAAEEALDAAIELNSSGQARLSTVLPAMDAMVREQRAFLTAVCRYNDDIGEYSLAVVPAQTSSAVLVSTLIKQAQPNFEAAPNSVNIPAQFEQPMTVPAVGVPASAGNPMPNRLKAELQPPALIAPPVAASSLPKPPQPMFQVPPVAATAPVVAPPTAPPAPPSAPASSAPAAPAQIREDASPSLAPPQESTIPIPPQADGARQPPVDGKSASAGTVRASFKPVVANEPRDAAFQLAAALFTDRSTAQPAGQPLKLVDCLRSAAPNHRLSAISAYWIVRRDTAIVQLYADEKERLDGLKSALAAHNSSSPTGMLNLRAAQTAVEARLADSQAEGLASEFELAIRAGLPTDNGPPRPTSIPFAGSFPIADVGHSWSVRQLSAELLYREKTVKDHTIAVSESDSARALATTDYFAGRTSVEHVLSTIDVQASETVAFIDGVADYNRVIAEYVVDNSAPNSTVETLAETLRVRE